MRIRIRGRDTYRKHCNGLKWQALPRMFLGNRRRVIRMEIGNSGS